MQLFFKFELLVTVNFWSEIWLVYRKQLNLRIYIYCSLTLDLHLNLRLESLRSGDWYYK